MLNNLNEEKMSSKILHIQNIDITFATHLEIKRFKRDYHEGKTLDYTKPFL